MVSFLHIILALAKVSDLDSFVYIWPRCGTNTRLYVIDRAEITKASKWDETSVIYHLWPSGHREEYSFSSWFTSKI